MKNQPEVLIFVLAGGDGQRLYPLTRNCAKPVIPFGGAHHLIDFTIANCLNSGFRQVHILTQHRSGSLHQHIRRLDSEEKIFRCVCAPDGKSYKGNADAVRQNVLELKRPYPPYILILSGDHVYRMDYRELIAFHEEHCGEATIANVEYPAGAEYQFGVISMDPGGRVKGLDEKPVNPGVLARKPSKCRVNMGVYVFNTEALVEALADGGEAQPRHDFGRDILPSVVRTGKVYGYNFTERGTRLGTYWRDIGTIDGYYRANMALLLNPSTDPCDSPAWPLYYPHLLDRPALIRMRNEECVVDSLAVSDASIDATARVTGSVLSSSVRVDRFATVENSILLPGAKIGAGAKVRRAIIDRDAQIGDGVEIGQDLNRDREFHTISGGGIVVVPARTTVAAGSPQPVLAKEASAAAAGRTVA